jgi:hypothetical protein
MLALAVAAPAFPSTTSPIAQTTLASAAGATATAAAPVRRIRARVMASAGVATIASGATAGPG